MKTDSEIQKDVKDELKWESRINGSEINVEVKNGFITLSGTIDSYTKKVDAERTAMRVSGVMGVINELEVRLPLMHQKDDAAIEKAILSTVKWNSSVDETKITVKVKNGRVMLEGEVPWEYQKSRLRTLAADVIGVAEVINLVKVVPNSAAPNDIKEKISAALKRNYYLNTNKINVSVEGNKAILTGQVRSMEERGAAETAAWSAPGITEVENRLLVSFSEVFV